MDPLSLFVVGAGLAGVNSALGAGQSFLSDWFGDANREDQAALDYATYKKKSALDWEYYHNFYGPYNQELQQRMFDYTSAGNIENIGKTLRAQKTALRENGYNPILAVNGGASAHTGVVGSTGAGLSPHSSSGVSTSGGSIPVEGGKLSLGEFLGAINSAAQADKTEAEAKQIKMKTNAVKSEADLKSLLADLEYRSFLEDGTHKHGIEFPDEKAEENFIRSLKNKYERDRFLNSLERQLIMDSVGVGTDALNSAAGIKRAFKPVKAR